MDARQKTPYFEWLRVFAAAAVVLMHTEGSLWPALGVQTREFALLTAFDSLVRWPVPVFVMITGALFLPRKTELKTVLSRYIPRMAAAFLFWSAVYALREGREGFVLRFVTGHYHLWYLPFVCGLYLTLPFLQRIAADRPPTRQLFRVSLVIGAAVPWLADLAALCFPRWGGVLASLKNSLHYTFFFDLLAVVLLGHLLHTADLGRNQQRLLCTAGICAAVLTFPLTLWASARAGTPNALFCQITAPTTLCAAAGVFVFAKYRLTRLPKLVGWMADRSFGVYLCHVLVLELLAQRGIDALSASPVWMVPLLAAAVFVLSLVLTELLRRVPVVGKWLV